jgi:predicted metal-dependent phosphoesterase TrpH
VIDLHLHTNRSDGSDTPLELLSKLETIGCNIFSVTDHDDISANHCILSEMKNNDYSAKFITGCEISSVFEGRNLHLLCYNFDINSEHVIGLINETLHLRRDRITAMFRHLQEKHNITLSKDAIDEILNLKVPGKVHITDAVMKQGVNIDRQNFFRNYLDDMESRHFKVDAEKVVSMITQAGGIVSFAHPNETQKEYNIDYAEIYKMTEKLYDKGLKAIEVYHSAHGKKDVLEYSKIASDIGLLISGGSDYHGKNKNTAIGQLTSYGFAPNGKEITVIKSFGS